MSFLQQTHRDFVGTRRFSNWVGEMGRAAASVARTQREKKSQGFQKKQGELCLSIQPSISCEYTSTSAHSDCLLQLVLPFLGKWDTYDAAKDMLNLKLHSFSRGRIHFTNISHRDPQ